MIENKSFSNGVQVVWDSTSIKLAGACQYMYYLKMIEQWGSPGVNVHLKFGSEYATALESYYKLRFAGADHDEALRKVVTTALINTWDSTTNTPWDSMDNYKTRETLIRTIIWYLDMYSLEEDPMPVHRLSDGSPAVEHSFLLPVDDGIVFSGHLDRLVNYAEGVWVMDQKTTKSTISPRYFDGYSPDDQMSMYTFAGQAIFATPVRGVIIDAAQIAVGFTRFERGFTPRSQAQLNEWYDDTMALIERTQRATLENHFPRNPTACGNYGGCQFRFVCARSPEHREQFLAGAFTKGVVWDPSVPR